MLDDYENEMLMNSRLSVLYSAWSPLFALSFIVSVIYILYGVLFWGMLWLLLALFCSRKIKKFKGKIVTDYILTKSKETK